MRDIEEKYKVFISIDENEIPSQRALAHVLEYSLGKVNYLLKALVKKGFVKLERIIKSDNKRGYMYILTPKGVCEKIRVTREFIKCKELEYEEVKNEIARLKSEFEE